MILTLVCVQTSQTATIHCSLCCWNRHCNQAASFPVTGQSRVIGDMIVQIWVQPCDWLNDFDPITGNDAD